MKSVKSALESRLVRRVVLALYLSIYLTIGIYTELKLMELFPIPEHLLQDQRYYDRALKAALEHRDPYANRNIGTGYLYPPQALLVIELFSHIRPFFLRVAIDTVVNMTLLGLMVFGIARYYGYSMDKIWYWFILCFGFAPFLELIHIGQINVITMFGILMMFFWETSLPILSGTGFSLAALTKVTPLLFLVYLIVFKRYKVIAFAALVTILWSLVSIFRYGVSPLLTYPDVFTGLLHQFLLTTNSQTLAAKLAVADYPEFQQFIVKLPVFLSQPLGFLIMSFTVQYRWVQGIYQIYILLVVGISALLSLRGKQPREPLFIVTSLGMMLAPNILWYHHYVFILLPLLIWMGWSELDPWVVAWCCLGLLTVQLDRRLPPYGLFIHVFGNVSMWIVLWWQLVRYRAARLARETESLDQRWNAIRADLAAQAGSVDE
jgi:glycosyl transferase family 87